MADEVALTRLFPNAALTRIERHRLGVAHFTANRKGERIARGRGRSTDFSDYRDYVPGDDIRFVDWNIFARLRRPYLKLFHEEEERHLAIAIDRSASMGFEDKLLRATQAALALGLVGLAGGERVSVYAMADVAASPVVLPPARGRRNLGKLVAGLEGLAAAGDLAPERAIERMLALHKGKGIAIVVSDFLTPGRFDTTFSRIQGAGLEPWALQILGPSELDPTLDGDLRLVDGETGHALDVTAAGDLLEIYHEHRLALEHTVSSLARRAGGRFLAASAGMDAETLVLGTMRRAGWITLR